MSIVTDEDVGAPMIREEYEEILKTKHVFDTPHPYTTILLETPDPTPSRFKSEMVDASDPNFVYVYEDITVNKDGGIGSPMKYTYPKVEKGANSEIKLLFPPRKRPQKTKVEPGVIYDKFRGIAYIRFAGAYLRRRIDGPKFASRVSWSIDYPNLVVGTGDKKNEKETEQESKKDTDEQTKGVYSDNEYDSPTDQTREIDIFAPETNSLSLESRINKVKTHIYALVGGNASKQLVACAASIIEQEFSSASNDIACIYELWNTRIETHAKRREFHGLLAIASQLLLYKYRRVGLNALALKLDSIRHHLVTQNAEEMQGHVEHAMVEEAMSKRKSIHASREQVDERVDGHGKDDDIDDDYASGDENTDARGGPLRNLRNHQPSTSVRCLTMPAAEVWELPNRLVAKSKVRPATLWRTVNRLCSK